MDTEITYKNITQPEEMPEIIELQQVVWGAGSITPMPHLVAAIHNGGVVIAAFHGDRIVGFCYGFPGFDGGEVFIVSHMAAVDPEFRNAGLGKSLKEKQREWAVGNGYGKIVWTFDPLESRNAFLNLCKLGGYVKTYIPSYYGEMNDLINKGLPSDRLVLEWKLNSSRVEKALAGKTPETDDWKTYKKLYDWKLDGNYPHPDKGRSPDGGKGYLLAVPKAIHDMKLTDFALVHAWRFHIRNHMEHALSQGYYVVGLLREDGPVNYYVLENEEPVD